jgi:hypothetical protein
MLVYAYLSVFPTAKNRLFSAFLLLAKSGFFLTERILNIDSVIARRFLPKQSPVCARRLLRSPGLDMGKKDSCPTRPAARSQ